MFEYRFGGRGVLAGAWNTYKSIWYTRVISESGDAFT